jgi:hypothetical protein
MSETALFRGLPLPNLGLILDDQVEVDEAMQAWRRIVSSMWASETLTAVNAPLIQQLVIIYALYERAVRVVCADGAILKPKKGSTRAIARISPHFTAMCKLSAADEFLGKGLRVIEGGGSLYPPPPPLKKPRRSRD